MHSYTSNSDPLEVAYDRPLPATSWRAAYIVALIVFLAGIGLWEKHWRDFGSIPSYRNSEGLWAMRRRRVEKEHDATVFIGSSRMMSNMQLHVWQRLDGKKPIQLALEGTTPIPVLEDLANDERFKGRLFVGVAPGLFYSGYSFRKEVLDYYPNETPAQRWGQWLSMKMLEPYLAYYEPDFALFSILKRMKLQNRPGVKAERDVRKLFVGDADRNNRLWRKLEEDKEYQDLAKSIWREGFRPMDEKAKAEAKKNGEKQIERAAAAVAKLRQRGVEVTFILHPVDGGYIEEDLNKFPRAEYWDVLLQKSGARGIHFQDHPELQGLNLPEWSHLHSADADRYTEAIYRIIQRQNGAAKPSAAQP